MTDDFRRLAHFVERISFAMAGVACGTFVAAAVGRADAALLQSTWLILTIIAVGGVGFYTGIDLPPRHHSRPGFDPACVLGPAGMFLTSASALASVTLLVLGADLRSGWLTLIAAGWIAGTALQVAAGAVARHAQTPAQSPAKMGVERGARLVKATEAA
jgi:hypothetical protein